MEGRIHKIQDIIGQDAGGRGMKPLVVPGDLVQAGKIFGNLPEGSCVIVLSGFPCCVNETPPTETDGPPGTMAIARAGRTLGYRMKVVTDACNKEVFAAALEGLKGVDLETFPVDFTKEDEDRFQTLAKACSLLIACERSGPSKDGNCYTMRGINMNEKGLISPLHRLVTECNAPFIGVGDGGNELGMGKVIDAIVNNPKIADGDKIGCVVPADHLIAASVSNWGGYALAAAAALGRSSASTDLKASLVEECLPTEESEVALLNRCVSVGCRDGVSGKIEATVDGMPLETSLQCLRDIRAAALGNENQIETE